MASSPLLMREKAVDFTSSTAFSRINEDDDGEYYDAIETVTPADLCTQNTITNFYANYIQDNDKVLDLMAADKSYLPNRKKQEVTGIGVKQADLDNNQMLYHSLIHDVNINPQLPFKDNSFNVVLCTFAIEYVTKPIELFTEVARILKLGGHFCIGFSDRFYKEKAIHLWQDSKSHERLKIVEHYFKQSQKFRLLVCKNSKDKGSCPAYMIKGTKSY